LEFSNHQKWGEKRRYKSPDFYTCFLTCSKNIEKWLRIYISYLVYNQIWLNIIREDCHIFFIFLWMYDVSKVVLVVNSLRHNFNPRFRDVGRGKWSVWPWETQNMKHTHWTLWGKLLTPSETPGADAGKAIAILCIVWNDIDEIYVYTFVAQYVHATKLQ